MRFRKLVLAFFLLVPAFTFAEPKADSAFVLRAFETLRANYFDSESLDSVKLFNAALKGTALVLKEKKVDFVPKLILPKASLKEAKRILKSELARALSLKPPDLPDKDLIFEATAAMLRAVGNSHVAFINPEETAENNKSLRGEPLFSGIGAIIGKLKSGGVYLKRVYKDGPADKAGLRRFDVLSEVDGVPVEKDPDLNKVISRIKGPKGTVVKITVKRPKGAFSADVVRGDIKDPKPEIKTLSERGKKIIYLRLYQFDKNAYLLPFELKNYRDQDEEGIIIDLRGNHGGLLLAVDVCLWMFLPENTPIYIMNRRGFSQRYFTRLLARHGSETALPMVVLIDEGSASGSEVLAGVLQEQRRAKVVGKKSAGAVSVANIFPLPFGSSMGVAVLEFVTAKGKVLEGAGVVPDKEVELTEKDILEGRDTQLSEALSLF